jgi:oligopeptide/dipeptide ABC transporter ATP-binding protein
VAALLEVKGLKKHYPAKTTLAEALRGKKVEVKAVDGIDFTLNEGESVGLVGESGCGKTTTGRLLLKLIEPTEGTVRFEGNDLSGVRGAALKQFRQHAQLVFQNPFDALNPRFTLYRSLAEPLVNAGVPKNDHRERIDRAMQRVHLANVDLYYNKYPHQVSGGQLQRVVLARALVLEPSFIVADEPVSMLDVSVRAGILNVMREARETLGLTAVYISHDLSLVRYVCGRTIVMYLGKIMEDGPTEQVIREPAHPYTQALVKAVPTPDPDQPHTPLPVKEGSPNAKYPPSGCRFRDRCPYAFERCAVEVPRPIEVSPGRNVFCHLYDQ